MIVKIENDPISEWKNDPGVSYDRHVFRPLVWTRLVREYGEFAVIILSKRDLIYDIMLLRQPVEGEREIKHYSSYESLEKDINRISKEYRIRVSDSEMKKIRDLWEKEEYYDASERRTVRVAFFPMDGYHITNSDGSRSGMDVVYLNALCEYTNWKIQYVDCDSWEEALEKLEDHKVDLVGSAQYSYERAEEFCCRECRTMPKKI